MQRVLVTGGAGFVGVHLVDALLTRGYAVRVLDSLSPPVHPDGMARYLNPAAQLIRGDVRDPDALGAALAGVDVVFHLAAYQDYLPEFSRFFSVNCAGTALLFEMVVADHLPVRRIIVASSQAVQGEGACLCDQHGRFVARPRGEEQLARGEWAVRCPSCGNEARPTWTDESVCAPTSVYGMSKRSQEELALALGDRYGLPTVALRYSIIVGPRQSFFNAYSGALRGFALRVLRGKPPVVFEDGQQLRDYVYVGDVVAANLLALDSDALTSRVLNVGSGVATTVLKLADLVIGAAGAALRPSLSGTYRRGDARHSLSDISALKRLGWSPKTTLAAAVEEYVRWLREVPDLTDSFVLAESEMRRRGVLVDVGR